MEKSIIKNVEIKMLKFSRARIALLSLTLSLFYYELSTLFIDFYRFYINGAYINMGIFLFS